MSTVETEQVLVVPTALFHEIGHFQGFSSDVERYMTNLLDPLQTSYRPRDEMETDPSFKQLIPTYSSNTPTPTTAFRYSPTSVARVKAKHACTAKISVGIGGHISSIDSQASGSGNLSRRHGP